MQKRARNLAAEELLIEVMEEIKELTVKLRPESLINNIKSIPLLTTFGWGRANRGISFSYVSFFSS